MNISNKKLLALLVIKARDLTIRQTLLTCEGKIKPLAFMENSEIGAQLEKDLKFVESFSAMITDDLLHNLLFALGENEEGIAITINGFSSDDLFEDGMNGELFSSEGWIAQYSEYASVY